MRPPRVTTAWADRAWSIGVMRCHDPIEGAPVPAPALGLVSRTAPRTVSAIDSEPRRMLDETRNDDSKLVCLSGRAGPSGNVAATGNVGPRGCVGLALEDDAAGLLDRLAN